MDSTHPFQVNPVKDAEKEENPAKPESRLWKLRVLVFTCLMSAISQRGIKDKSTVSRQMGFDKALTEIQKKQAICLKQRFKC